MMAVLTDLGLTGLLADLVANQSSSARSETRIVLKQRIALSFVASCLIGVAFLLATDVSNWAVPVVFAVSMFANAVYSTYSALFAADWPCWLRGGERSGLALAPARRRGCGCAAARRFSPGSCRGVRGGRPSVVARAVHRLPTFRPGPTTRASTPRCSRCARRAHWPRPGSSAPSIFEFIRGSSR